jgi:hypothetical protein
MRDTVKRSGSSTTVDGNAVEMRFAYRSADSSRSPNSRLLGTMRLDLSDATSTDGTAMVGGDTQVCSRYYWMKDGNRMETPPVDTVQRILDDKLGTEEARIDCVSYLNRRGVFDNIDPADLQGNVRQFPGEERISVACHINRVESSTYFNFYQTYNRIVFFRDQLSNHVSFHGPSAGNPKINTGRGKVHSQTGDIRSVDSYKIRWKMCATADCQLPPRGTQQIDYELHRNRVRYSIHTDIDRYQDKMELRHRPTPVNQFLFTLITHVRNYLVQGVNINVGDYRGLDMRLRESLYLVLRDTCADMNHDNIQSLDKGPAEMPRSTGLYYSTRRGHGAEKFASYGPLHEYPIDSWEIRGTPRFTNIEYRIKGVYTHENALQIDHTTTTNDDAT